MALKEDGGELTNLGDIHRYCELDYGLKFVLREDARVTFDEVLKDEKYVLSRHLYLGQYRC